MMLRNGAKFITAVALMFLICCSNQKPVNVNSNTSGATQKTTYWVVVMWTLIGTGYMSKVCPLPTDDNESVAAAASAWGGSKGRMTSEGDVHGFATQEEAEKFRREKGYIELDLTSEELMKYLCIGQPQQPSKDYWVVVMFNAGEPEKGNSISEVCHLPDYSSVNILAAADRWGSRKGFTAFDGGAYKFPSREEAEVFRKSRGYLDLRLNANELIKYLNINQPSQPPTEYWLVVVSKDNKQFISEVCPLPASDTVSILAAADRWGSEKRFKTTEAGAYRFIRQEDAEKFRKEKGLPFMALNASSLQKFLCARQPIRPKSDEPSTDKSGSKPPDSSSSQKANKKAFL
jgi:hypothetical protein